MVNAYIFASTVLYLYFIYKRLYKLEASAETLRYVPQASSSLDLEQPVSQAEDCMGMSGIDIC